jgi:septum formation protein
MLILASASPRRRELLSQAGFSFAVQAADLPEGRLPDEDGIRLATRLAREKAEAVFHTRSSGNGGPSKENGQPLLVLGADTVVVCETEILGKPADAADAARMLRLLSGRTHQVMTGVALISGAPASPTIEIACEVTHVTMQALSQEEIDRYVRSGDPMDKAGAYGIQGYAGRWIPRIQGCYFNVVGLPLALVTAMIESAETRLAEQDSGSRSTLTSGEIL